MKHCLKTARAGFVEGENDIIVVYNEETDYPNEICLSYTVNKKY